MNDHWTRGFHTLLAKKGRLNSLTLQISYYSFLLSFINVLVRPMSTLSVIQLPTWYEDILNKRSRNSDGSLGVPWSGHARNWSRKTVNESSSSPSGIPVFSSWVVLWCRLILSSRITWEMRLRSDKGVTFRVPNGTGRSREPSTSVGQYFSHLFYNWRINRVGQLKKG